MTHNNLFKQGALWRKLHMFKQRYLNDIPSMSKGSARVAYPMLFLLRFAAVFLMLLTLGVGNAWGTDATFSWTSGGTMGTNATGSQGQITLSGNANSASGAPAVTSNTLRLYAHRSTGDGASATFTAGNGYQITGFTITSSNGGTILKYGIDGATPSSTFTWSNQQCTISNLEATSFTIKNCQNSGKSNTTIQVASVVVTYESTTPSGYTLG